MKIKTEVNTLNESKRVNIVIRKGRHPEQLPLFM